MEKLKPKPSLTEKPIPSMEDLDGQITKLLDPKITEYDWKAYWKNPDFTQLFPNLTFRLISLDGINKYAEKQKQRIFESGFRSFMELPLSHKELATVGKMLKVNEETQLWERIKSRTEEPGKEPLIRLLIGCSFLLGLSLKNKEDAINLIIESYNNLVETPSKQKSFRSNIIKLITTGSRFRQWVMDNNLDRNNGFEWDSEVTGLALKPLPQDKFPTEFKDLKNYPPRVIAKFVDYILGIATGTITNPMRTNINIFQAELEERIKSPDFNDYPKLDELQQKLKQLNSLIAQ